MKKITLLALGLMMTLGAQVANAAELYGYRDGTTLYICYDNNKSSHDGAQPAPTFQYMNSNKGWLTIAENYTIRTIVLDASVQNARPTSTYGWFAGLEDVTSISNLNYLNTSQVTEMNSMFSGCHSLQSIDLSGFNTSNVTTMSLMFQACDELTTLDISNFDFQSIQYASYMFAACSKLATIKCDQDWNKLPGAINGAISAEDMFFGSTKLKGGKGTAYDANHVDKGYARPDAPGFPGYFTGTFCPIATNQDAKDITTSSARITWTADSRQNKYEIRYWKVENHEGYYSIPDVTGTSYTLTNLEENTWYRVWLVSECDNGYGVRHSAESGYVEFKTVAECPAAYNIRVYDADITATSAKVSWDANGINDQWEVRYMKPLDAGYSFQTTTDRNSTITGLQPDTEYDVWVVSYCDTSWNYEAHSVDSETVRFRTLKNTEGIDEVQGDKVQGTKVIKNGQLFILVGDKMFNAQGVEVK